MINTLRLLRNVGQFESIGNGVAIPFSRIALIYAENGRGKTTLAAILRSLASGDPLPILERHRLAADHPPHVVLDCAGDDAPVVFQGGAWSRTVSDLVVFDDIFVDQNICSGLAVGAAHRQNLHELILGARGVALNRELQTLVAQVEAHNAALREKAAAIPAASRGTLSVDEYCALPIRTDIDGAIQAAERNLAAARERESVSTTAAFGTLALPEIDIAAIDGVLGADLATLDMRAAALVQAHLQTLGPDGETWIGEGMAMLVPGDRGDRPFTCPFCVQDLAGSSVIEHYRAYFGAAYSDLKEQIATTIVEITESHAGDAPVEFERAVRVAVEGRQFWSRYCDVPEVAVDSATLVRDWRAARDAIVAVLGRKQAAPLERLAISPDVKALVATYEVHRKTVSTLNRQLREANTSIGIAKEQAAVANTTALAADVARLKATKNRHKPEAVVLCDDYLRERAAKSATEARRDEVRAALERERTNVFPGYEAAINAYLQRFGAGFRLESVTAANTRGGPTCTYDLLINNTSVHIGGGVAEQGQPSFGNTLSAGDRNTLALAFFFASLDQDPDLGDKTVVIDDPISSLDEHRALTTVQELRRIGVRAAQVIVLSHNRPFLCRLWEGLDSSLRTAAQLVREGEGSTLRVWDVSQDSITEHDRRDARLREYVARDAGDRREVARSIRPHLEAFLRVAFPGSFPPGTLLGAFRRHCRECLSTPAEALDQVATEELGEIAQYANRFHHDTNPAWESEAINDGELRDFVVRTLRFAKR